MSNEPKLSELLSEPAPGDPPPRTSGRSVDAELVLAAIDRMEAAMRSERVTLDCLHAELAAMAKAIAQAKIAVQPGAVKPGAADGGAALDVAALLDELQHRVDVMLEIGGRFSRGRAPADDQVVAAPPGRDAPEEIVEPPPAVDKPLPQPDVEGVPTVSGVVSRLGRAGGEPAADASLSGDGAGRPPSAAILEAMVLALSALDPVGDGETETPAAAPAAAPAAVPAVTPAAEPFANGFAPASEETGTTVSFAPWPPESVPIPFDSAEPHPGPRPDEAAPSAMRPDPLARLKAMSAEERIALFS
jgi:hypothetical protein